ncbi:NAD(P)/FAD-dependent oxidoreductase [Pseudodesulfovibrio thermohalotolerans]|uniref:phytoene desaturase family protein n=1 Tax=Pseudodesulfovibrio thermohalotolerans TaxID=2880651 RepID=UPI0024426678|nr:NAD(P)/FAD-dependent oxidoreductase [Pseudodesulfovibrio thermohalotolerans]WFS63847.1 NAD(P)/FAD-dependent oxidoreductase [Pseudodesulfovibrio thermohalotolerans]
MPRFDHIVVGGGISGMTAALLLARSGARIALAEAFPRLSPTVRGFRRGGVQFDTGLHYVGGLGDGHPLDVYFKHLGIAPLIGKKPYRLEGFDRFVAEPSGRSYAVPSGFEACKAYLNRCFPAETVAIECYLDAVDRNIATSPFLNFTRPFDLNGTLHGETTTLRTFLDDLTDNEELKAVLSFHTLLYGVPPEDALFSTHALVAGSYLLSTHGVEGGGHALVRAFETRLAEAGVDVFLGHSVRSVGIDAERRVTGVVLDDGREFAAPSCLWTAHPRGLIEATPDAAFRPAFKKRLALLEDTASALMLFGVSEALIPSLDGQNVILWPGRSLSDDLKGVLPVQESMIFLSASEDPGSGKMGVTAIVSQAFSPFAPWADSLPASRPEDYRQRKAELLYSFEREVFRRMPELSETVRFVQGATPLTFRDFCAAPSGSLYGLCHSINQFNPAPVTKVEGLTLAGQGIVAPGILGAVISAYLTCGIILGHESLHSELRQYA